MGSQNFPTSESNQIEEEELQSKGVASQAQKQKLDLWLKLDLPS